MGNNKQSNTQANEAVSKFKLLSAYGGPGSLIHTAYGSVIVSCIEEWGFMNKVIELRVKAVEMGKPENEYVSEHAKYDYDIYLSNDERLLEEIRRTKGTENLRYLALIPDIELNDHFGTIKDRKANLAINSEYMPKGFYDKNNHFKTYNEWFKAWPKDEASAFSPPKYIKTITSAAKGRTYDFIQALKQDNIVLICRNGHMSDFPWSRFLRWRLEQPHDLNKEVDLFKIPLCCSNPDIQINETSANASGFDGKWLKCNNSGCPSANGISLKGIMSLKIHCPGHKPWESETGASESYFGKLEVRRGQPMSEPCERRDLKVALTTGNNLYFSRILTSIFMPAELFLDEDSLKIRDIKVEMEAAKSLEDYAKLIVLKDQIKDILAKNKVPKDPGIMTDSQWETNFRYQEYTALVDRSVSEINVQRRDLLVHDTTNNLDPSLLPYFERILRIDRLKVTSSQLDFSRVEPYESGSNEILNRNIFRSSPENVLIYPVVENYGEGIFFAFKKEEVRNYLTNRKRFLNLFERQRSDFAQGAKFIAEHGEWQLYMIHTFCHLVMRELEFRCGYPTASLSERIFVSNESNTEMYGFLIYTAEGAEGSMGGLIAQTREKNLNDLIKSALLRATICNSDPLCWQSDGQGLFELNLASCFSCGLVSETSCELRNIYLDRQVLIDEEYGFFKNVLGELK